MGNTIKLSSLRSNPRNPRQIRDERFVALCKSLKEFPQMMELRPIITDADGVILGGNMRFRALQANGMKQVPASWVRKADSLSAEEKRRFIVMDNEGFGEWDFDIISADYDMPELEAFGMELPEICDKERADCEPLNESVENLRPVKRCHLLISMTADQALDLMPRIQIALEGHSVEMCHAEN